MDPQRLLLAATGQAAAVAAASCLPNLSSKGFKQLLDTQSLVDCTLACNGGKLSAHKIVLSACSSYLARILLEHPVEHPIIILPELSIDDVRTLVHYMYTGELLRSNKVNSASLLKTAAILSINSLNDLFKSAAVMQQQQQQQQQQQLLTNSALDLKLSNSFSSDLFNSINSEQQQQTSDSPEPATLNDDPQASESVPSSMQSSAHQTNILHSSSKISQRRHRSSQSATATPLTTSTSSSGEFQFKCQICQNDFQTICSFEYHMQRAHNVTSFGCEICHKPFASLRYVLTDHMRRCHGWRPTSSNPLSQNTGPNTPSVCTTAEQQQLFNK